MASKRDLLPFRDLLQKQIALALGGIIPSARDSALEEVVASFPKPKSKPVDLVKQWSDGIDETIDLVFDDEGFRTAPHYISLRITHLYADGEVHFSIVYSGETYHVFIRTKAGQPRVGCSCDASNGDGVCIHVEFAFDYLVDQFQFRHTPLCRRIAEARFDTGTPDHKKFHIDRSLIALEAISQFIKNSDEYKPADAELPKQDTKNATEDRLVWNLRGTINDLSISAHIQSKKKNGTGYTKGKRSSVQDVVVHYHHLLNDRDRKVLAIARKEYGDKELSIPALDALGLLVGAGNVCHDGEQIVVEQTGFYLGIAESSKGLHFAIGAENDLYREVVCFPSSNYAVTIDNKEKRVLLLTYPDGTRDGIGALLRLPPIEVKYAKEFIEKAIELQKRFPIKLPMDIAGAYHDDPGKLVIMLRSRPDGRLDYGLRIKTQTGLISLPGAPPAVVRGTHDGKQVQWIRRGASEIKNAAQLATTLGVNANTSNDFTGTIEDFDQGIRFLELLEKTKESLEVLWNKDSEKPIRMLGSVSAKNLRVEITSKRNWFGITGECKMGHTTLSLESLLENLGGTPNPAMGDYVQVGDGQWARIEQSLREKLEHLRGASHLDRKNLMMDATAAMAIRSLASEDVEVKAAKSWQQCMMRLARADSLDPVLPTGLHAELRDYQVEGFRWLRRLAEWGVGGILADDMGLGKTLQTLAVLLDRASEGPTLVIAPTSVGFNWVRETQRFAPDLTPILYRESDRQELLTNLKSGDVVVSSYALALRDGSELAKIEWGTLVMDEAQAIKNSRSKTSQAVSNFNAKWSIALTGTPMENHLGELWSLFSVVSPGVFGGWESFRKRFATPIEKQNDPEARASLAKRLQPFILRRTKEEVLTELPPRTEMVLYVDLSPEERAQYELVRRSAIGEIENIAALPEIKDQRFKILALMTRLRQFACHPGMVNKQWDRSSAKLDQLCETLDNLREENHRALVFSQFTEHLALICKALDERGITYQYLDGSTPAVERQKRVDEFQNGKDTAFLISLKAGGTGLNLTAADYVIHMDPWWNPAVEDQATDRAHRYGQDKPVMVYRIVARGTIEEEILALHETKRDLVEGILEGTSAAGKLSTQDLMAMIRS